MRRDTEKNRTFCTLYAPCFETDVLIITVFETVHAYHQVADGGGKVWVRLGDEVREADQWLIRALSGQRGLHRPVPELVVQEDGGTF